MSVGGNNQNNSDIAMMGIRIQGLRIRKSQGGTARGGITDAVFSTLFYWPIR